MMVKYRAIELHCPTSIWNAVSLLSLLDLMHNIGYNALILHENNLVDQLTYPGFEFCGSSEASGVHKRYQCAFREIYKLAPTQRSKVFQKVEFMNWVVREASQRGITVFFNVKELSFMDHLLAKHPELIKENTICPSNEYWWTFIEKKYQELFEDIPDLQGVLVSPGTSESRLSVMNNTCKCNNCRRLSPSEWFRKLIAVLDGVCRRMGKMLIIRDFSFRKADQQELVDAVVSVSPTVGISVKNTPHDFYPTFPDNPLIAKKLDRPKWVEFDCMGQYFGWGVAPTLLLNNYRSRLERVLGDSIDGILMRIDWESLPSHTALQTLNSINVWGISFLINDCSLDDVTVEWLEYQQVWKTRVHNPDVAKWFYNILESSWEIVKSVLYAHDCVINDCSNFPVSVDHLFWLAEEKNSLKDWDPSKASVLSMDAKNITSLLAEKEAGMDLFKWVCSELQNKWPGDLDPGFKGQLKKEFNYFGQYIEGFYHLFKCTVLMKHLESLVQPSKRVRADLRAAIKQARNFLERLAGQYETYPYPVSVLLSPQRFRVFYEDLNKRLTKGGQSYGFRN